MPGDTPIRFDNNDHETGLICLKGDVSSAGGGYHWA
jgi:hypothetical protein